MTLSSCVGLVVLSVSGTILTEASKEHGTYPYNTFLIPCTVEAVKFVASAVMFMRVRAKKGKLWTPLEFDVHDFFLYAFPALCFFVSNNCVFHIIQHLDPCTFQVMSNLKVLSTGIFMHVFLNRKLSWAQWKALVLLAVGCMVTQLRQTSDRTATDSVQSPFWGYIFLMISVMVSSAGNVFSEKLLKRSCADQRKPQEDRHCIHHQNMQLYTFGFVFGVLSLQTSSKTLQSRERGIYHGFNAYAYALIVVSSACGLLISFILKHLDAVAKCFCAAMSMLGVAFLDSTMRHETLPLCIVLGVVLVFLALEQYSTSSFVNAFKGREL